MYKIRVRSTGDFINKKNSYGGSTSVDRVYETLGHARVARTQLGQRLIPRVEGVRWWDLSEEDKAALVRDFFEIVEFECIEKGVVE